MIDYIETDARRGLEVKRFHTWPVLRQQTTGEHAAQVMRIMLAVWPVAPRHVLVHCLTHDMGEMAGDQPWPTKLNDPVLKERTDAAEAFVYDRMVDKWKAPGRERLSMLERNTFKMCEYIEMWEYALTEINLGNQYARCIAVRMLLEANKFMIKIPDMVIVNAARSYVKSRTEQEMYRD
jgi:hypothetical protein